MPSRFRIRLRMLFVIWIVAVGLLGLMVARDPGLEGSSHSLFTFLLQRAVPLTAPAVLSPAPPVPVHPEEPLVRAVAERTEPIPPVVSPTPPVNLLLPKGKKQGNGTFGPFRVLSSDETTLVLSIPYTGTLGDYTAFSPANLVSRSVNLHGNWKFGTERIRITGKSPVRLVQGANHNNFVRVSFVAQTNLNALREQVEYTPTAILITISTDPEKR